jgi:hypothetical protein
MTIIPVERFIPVVGTIEACLFENRFIDLAPTLFYNITIPLEPFDSGIEYEDNPVETAFSLDFLNLPARDWRALDTQTYELSPEESDASIYLGGAHNPVNVERLQFTHRQGLQFKIECRLFCDFEAEGVGDNRTVELTATLDFTGLRLELGAGQSSEQLQTLLNALIEPAAYQIDGATLANGVLILPVEM